MNSLRFIRKISASTVGKCSELCSTAVAKVSRPVSGAAKLQPLGKDTVNFTSQTSRQIFKEFKPAANIKEAVKRAEQEFGIHTFDFKDIDVANDALFVLHKIKSKSIAPLGITEIKEVPIIMNDPNIAGCIYSATGVMEISTCGLVNSFAEKISPMAQQVPYNKMHEYLDLFTKLREGKIPLFKLTKDIETLGLKVSRLSELPFQTLIHEQGHRAHYLAVGNDELFSKMHKFEEIREIGITDFSIFNEFMSKKTQDIISSWQFLEDYAKTSPCEFVAEVYSALIHGIKVPENIMVLYNKYHGPNVITV